MTVRRTLIGAKALATGRAIKEALDKNGITIPFPTRTLQMVEEAKGAKSGSTKKAA